MNSYTNYVAPKFGNLSFDGMKAVVDKFKAITHNRPISIRASLSVIAELRERTFPAAFQANRLNDTAGYMLTGLPIIPEPALRDGSYVIEYGDGHMEFHGQHQC